MKRAQELIDLLLRTSFKHDDGRLANELLSEFHNGYPVDALRPLLASPDEGVRRTAAFIATELGVRASPLLTEMVKLLHDSNRFNRSDAIGSVLACATGSDKHEIAAVVRMLGDPDPAIRWNVMDFLSLASTEQLRAALEYFQLNNECPDHVQGLKWLTSERAKLPDEIAAWVNAEAVTARKYGVVAGARISEWTEQPLRAAMSSADQDVRGFAESELRSLQRSQGEE